MFNKRKLAGVVMLVAAIGCVSYLVYQMAEKEENENVYDKLQEEVKVEDIEAPEEEEYVCPIDFDVLHQVNPDIYAWIEIPGTEIRYPIVQSPTDDTYYLNHTIEGKSGYPGSIYTESLNSREFEDYNTIIYGHNMKDGTMFKGLHNYEDPEYMRAHPTVEIYTPEKKLTYRIFAAVVYSDMHILKGYDFTNPDHREAYLESIRNARNMKNFFDESVVVDKEDKLLTLSTCIGGQADKRYLVEAVLMDE